MTVDGKATSMTASGRAKGKMYNRLFVLWPMKLQYLVRILTQAKETIRNMTE
jgi:hypothetical protein